MTAQADAAAARRSAALFRLEGRGLLAVTGGDRVRWLDGMVSGDVASLAPGRGCAALALTRQGRIVADLHVLQRGDEIWLELALGALGPLVEHLDKFIIADDVSLEDRSGAFARLALEGPAALSFLREAAGEVDPIAPDAARDLALAGATVTAWAWGWSGEPALQLLVPAASAPAVVEALGAGGRLPEGGSEALEILRIEAGVPAFGAELDETVLPAEAGLEDAVSFDKGCYTGQEVVARMASRGQAGHRLVGLSFPGGECAPAGTKISDRRREVGELTSACVSPSAGAIGLGFVRRGHEAPGTALEADGREARVAALPFVAPGGRPA